MHQAPFLLDHPIYIFVQEEFFAVSAQLIVLRGDIINPLSILRSDMILSYEGRKNCEKRKCWLLFFNSLTMFAKVFSVNPFPHNDTF